MGIAAADHGNVHYLAHVTTSFQYREALARIRALDGASEKSPEGRERAALERAVSRFLLVVDQAIR